MIPETTETTIEMMIALIATYNYKIKEMIEMMMTMMMALIVIAMFN
jgi:hypothetical protein